MKFYPTTSFVRSYKELPLKIQKKESPLPFDEEKDIWQARVNRNYRFYFLIKGDTYILLEVKPHPK